MIEIRTSKSAATTCAETPKDHIYQQAYHTKLKSLGGLKKKRSFCEVKFDLHRVKIIHAEVIV